MASVTLSPPFFPFETNSDNRRDDSFSSYLTLIRDNFLPELGTSCPNPVQISLVRKRTNDGELDIFGAEKYFGGGLDNGNSELISENGGKKKNSFKREEEKSGGKFRSTTCSETSRNSQITLLRERRPHPPPADGQKQAKQAKGKRFLGIFRCSCSRKNAVQVDGDRGHETHSSNSNKGSSRSRSLTVLTSVAGGRGHGDMGRDDDLGSDASSDLFEISSLSINLHPFFQPERVESSPACYEPSEASIEWSVATASAANFSVASDCNTERPSARAGDGKKRRPPGLLLGCVKDTAVNVTAEKVSTRELGLGLGSSRVMDLDAGRGARALEARIAAVPLHALGAGARNVGRSLG